MDSPPTSIIWAPSSSRVAACFSAFSLVEKISSVGERVGGYVQDAHKDRAGAESLVPDPERTVGLYVSSHLLLVAVAVWAATHMDLVYGVLLDETPEMGRVYGFVLDQVFRELDEQVPVTH